MLDKSTNLRDNLALTNTNFHSLDLNRSTAKSVLTSSYIVSKDGTKKRKRNANSYMEEFLEKRRMAAEFAQSKRSTSTKHHRVKITQDEESKKEAELDDDINIKKIEERININNLKNNLPGKTKELIDNTNNNMSNNKSNSNLNDNNYLSRYINVISNNPANNKYNNFKRHNIIYTKKNNLSQNNIKNTNISNHSFTEDRYNTNTNHDNDDQCNIIIKKNNNENNQNNTDINIIKDISPIKQNHIILNAKGGIDEKDNKIIKHNETEEEKNETKDIINNNDINNKNNKILNNSEHFLSIMEKMINVNINKSQPSDNNLKKFLNINEESKLDKEDNININNNKEEKLNLNLDDISNMNSGDKNEEYIVEENEEKNMAYEKEEENEEQENEEEENNKINDINNNNEIEEEENEDLERCEVVKGEADKSKFIKGKKNIITEEIEEVEENMEANENTSEFPTNKTGRNKNNTAVILENKKSEEKKEDINIIKDEKKYNNFSKIEIKDLRRNKNNNNINNNININNNNKENKNYTFVYSNTFNKQISDKSNSIENTEEENNTTNNIVNISKSNNKDKEGNINNKEIINIKNNIFMNNDDFNFNKLSDTNNNINSDINESPERQDFISIMNKDIERLERIRNNNINNELIKNETKENKGYIYEIDNFINLIREKRKSINNNINNNNNLIINEINYKTNNNDYIPPKNILELNKIYKDLNNRNNTDINLESNYNNNILQKINYNKMKLPIYKSTTLQSLLNEIKKEKTYNININNININNENKIINNNFFTEKINRETSDSLNKNDSEQGICLEDNEKSDLKLFDETKFKKIKETNLRKRNKFRSEFKFKDYETNNNLSNHIYLDKVKEDILSNISTTKANNQNEIKNRFIFKKFNYLNNVNNINIDIDDSEIMPANNMKSLYSNNKF